MILLQGHDVTLTFKVATQMMRATRNLNMVIISVKYFFGIQLQITTLLAGHNFAARSCCDLPFKVATQMLQATRHLNMVIIFVK